MAEEKKEPTEPTALREVLEGLSVRSQQAKSDDDSSDKKHAFWDTQPVPSLSAPPQHPGAHRLTGARRGRVGGDVLSVQCSPHAQRADALRRAPVRP